MQPEMESEETAELHRVCNLCSAICESSPCLESMFSLHSIKQPVKNARRVWETTKGEWWQFHNVQSLESSSLEGCHFCTILWDELKRKYGSNVANTRLNEQLYVGFCKVSLFGCEAMAADLRFFGDSHSIGYNSEVYISPARYRVDPRSLQSKAYCKMTTEALAAIIRTHLQHCQSQHRICNSHSDGILRTAEMPTRVIDVSDVNRPRLAYGTSIPSCEYITLSHSWGDTSISKLLSGNHDTWFLEIPSAELTPKFRDAMAVAKALNVNYLWIDSLCVIQDSGDDWAVESNRMARVYANAHLNLICGGLLSSDRLCSKRNPLSVFHCSLLYSRGMSCAAVAYRDPRPYKGAELLFPVVSRAWVLQERILSRRNAYLGGEFLYWECCESEDSELISETHNPYWLSLLFTGALCKRFLYQTLTGKYARNDEYHPLHDNWRKLVCDFTSRSLSVSSDRIAAIAGMAKAFHGFVNSPYIYGLWQRWPKEDLLWHRYKDGRAFPRPKDRTVPTWSWMSIDGPVCFENGIAAGCTVEGINLEISTIPERKNIFGEVEKAALHLKGTLIQVEVWEPRGQEGNLYTAQWKGCDPVEFIPDITLAPFETLYFLLLGQRTWGFGLVLSQIGLENQFERVGYFDYYIHSGQQPRPWRNGEERVVAIQ
ncbi:heterokaryon incompatibility protein-domain-containing protein [Bisporella sp. PMI_857]|nr:heterokaryon incompatibility protein-domain-containing protein [Bisporella sp. PMI_857]